MTTLNLATAIAQAKQAVVRHEHQHDGDPFRFDLTEHRYVALRDLLDALSTPPADDVHEATPTEWSEQMDAERARQIEHGYDDAHDAEQGPAHLLNWAIDYGRRGKHIAAATLTRNALRLLGGRPAAATEEGPDLVGVIEGCVPDEIPGWRFRYSERIAAAVRAAFEVRPRGTVTDAERLEYTIAAELENGFLTQLADYTTVVRDHLKADLELYRLEEERAKGSPERIIIAERPIPKWKRS